MGERRGSTATDAARDATGPAGRFAAIDFETADHGRDSACALAVVVVEGSRVVREAMFLIRPPRRQFLFTWVHGIAWPDVADAPRFGEVWPEVAPLLEGVEFLAAHNAGFDRSVLYQCCHAAGLAPPAHRFQCTVKLARQSWGLASAKLPEVCGHLGIPLRHHEAASDARACAEIVLAARSQGLALGGWLGAYRGRMPGGGAARAGFEGG
jgi:DNA polymerase-3 subunit epsilon